MCNHGHDYEQSWYFIFTLNFKDSRVAQYPHELITYGGNGSVFNNWAQYLVTMKYLSEMEEDQTLDLYSGF
jgi:urocanate hydratase